MTDLLTEFAWITPDEVHLVKTPANGVPLPILAKMASEVDAAGEAVVKEFVDGLCRVERCSVCKDRLGTLSETQVAKAVMHAKERNALGSKDFAFPKDRKEPLNDEAHVRNAISRFSQVQGVSDKDRKRAARRIIGRAKSLGIEVSEDSDVAQAAKQTAPDKAVPEGEALSQTHEQIEGDPSTGTSPEPNDGGAPRTEPGADVKPSETTGQGDTAPDKALPTEEAESQTAGAQKSDPMGNNTAGEADGTGDKAPNGDAAAADAKREAESQTEAQKATANTDPGSPAWEHKDVALGEKAEQLIARLGEVVHTFTEREKAEGGASKSARRVLAGIEQVADNPKLLKEMADMPHDELLKALDELGTARQKAKKEAKKAKAAKAAKREKKAAKAADKAAKATGEPVADERLTKALEEFNEMKETVEKIASEDGRRIVLNEAGITAIVRGPESASVFKELENHVAVAEARLEKAVGDAIPMANQELKQARAQLATAKMIAAENARAADPAMLQRRLNGLGVPLFKNSHALPEDRNIRYPGI